MRGLEIVVVILTTVLTLTWVARRLRLNEPLLLVAGGLRHRVRPGFRLGGTSLGRRAAAVPPGAGNLPGFDPSDTPEDPVALFTEWLLEAVRAGVREPPAMTLATVDAEGNPAARVLILKDVGERGWQFASDAGSARGRDVAARPSAALTFYWAALARQVRVRGPALPEEPERSAADFLARGPGARAEALPGRQSQPLAGLAERDAAVRESSGRLARTPGLVAPGWTLYALRPVSVEFWQGDKERRHTRLVYRASAQGWTKQLLRP